MTTELRKLIATKLLNWSFRIMPECKFKGKLAALMASDLLNGLIKNTMVMTTKIKTFEDLRFKEGIQQRNIAFLTLDNGYKINVQHHKDYSSGRVYYIGISRFGMCISEHRYQTKEEVNTIIKDTQKWPPA